MRWPARRHRDQDGTIAVLVALTSVIVFVIAGLVVDLGLARVTKMQSQNAADAAALAAASALYPPSGTCTDHGSPPCRTDALDVAVDYLESDVGGDQLDWATCPAPPAGFSAVDPGNGCVSIDSWNSPQRVWITVPTREVATPFGTLAGVSRVPVSARAQARITATSSAACGLCVLDDTTISGNTGLNVTGAGIGMNGRPVFSGNTTVTVDSDSFTTELPPSESGNVHLSPEPRTGVRVSDPFADLDLPLATDGLEDRGSVTIAGNGSCVLLPGRYGSISFSGNHVCTLEPGLYAITGTVSMSGNTVVDATSGVTLYFTCGTSAAVHECGTAYPHLEAGGSLDYTGNQRLQLVAPDSGPGKGLAIVYDRHNTSNLDYSGNTGNELFGSVYAASATMNLSGNSSTAALDSMIVVKSLRLSGNSTITNHYTAAHNADLTRPSVALSR